MRRSGPGSATWARRPATTPRGSPASTAPSPAAPSQVSHLSLFPMPTVADVRAHLLAQDVVWVGGGSVANLLAVWRVHGLDEVFREVWEAGVVLGGVSAGSLCWHVGGTTDSFGPDLRPVTNGLGADPHVQRRPLRLRGAAPAAVPPAGRRGHPARRPRHRRRRRPGLPRHRARRGGGRPARRGRLPGRARAGRHGGRDPRRAAPARASDADGHRLGP